MISAFGIVHKDNWGEKSQSGSKGVVDNATYDQKVGEYMGQLKRNQRKLIPVSMVGGAGLGALATMGKKPKSVAVGAGLGALAAGGLTHGSAIAGRKRLSNKLSDPQTRFKVERGMVERSARATGGQINRQKWG